MTTYLFEIGVLEDILDTLVFEDEPTLFSEEYALELVETALHLMEEYMNEYPDAISEPNFHETLIEEIKEIFYAQFEEQILDSDFVEEDMDEILEYAFSIFITTFYPERSIYTEENEDIQDPTVELDNEDNIMKHKIQSLREIPQPVQRTPEWYKFRWNLITASSAWKAFGTQSSINQLIYEKCKPLPEFNKTEETNITDDNIKIVDMITDDVKTPDIKMVNTNTTLHWGQKYEPLSVMLYEHIYNSKVEDFGCIQHPKYNFIGASPDGIVIDSTTGRYGRMLEIKNIVNREINGIPKKEYWIQMQLQMEVCDLDECDFLETKFVEYPDYNSYVTDSMIGKYNEVEFNSYTTTANGDYKGIIIYFHKSEGSPHYEYMPLTYWTPDVVKQWEETTIQKYESEPYNYMFVKFIYWKLEKLSCVLVLRNKEWFKNNIGQLEKVWNIIEKERISGYEHRAPVRKVKKEVPLNSYKDNKEECFLKIIKS